MVNESAKTPVGRLLTPGEIMVKIPPRDRKRAFSETRSESLSGKATPSQPTLATDGLVRGKLLTSKHKKMSTVAVKQIINLVPKLSSDVLSQVVGSILKRKKKKVHPGHSSEASAPNDARRGSAKAAPKTPVIDRVALRSPPEPSHKTDQASSSSRQREPQLKNRSSESIEDLKEHLARPLRPSSQSLDTVEDDLAHDLLREAS